MYKTELKVICFSQCSLVIRGTFAERIYHELRGKPVIVAILCGQMSTNRITKLVL
jgi:hypothetical protein